jgi:glutaredoxin-related protein
MQRNTLPDDRIDPAIRERIATSHRDIVEEVDTASAAHSILVVGMKQNPFPRRARKALRTAGLPFHYLEYGSYLGDWRRRTALKMWTGWPTFPMVFVNRVLIGGAEDLQRLIDSGELATRLGNARPATAGA